MLGREQQTGSVTELKRLQAVRLYGSGMGQIRDITGCAESNILKWVQDYRRERLAGLRPHYERSAQNASKLTGAQQAEGCRRLQAYRPDQV